MRGRRKTWLMLAGGVVLAAALPTASRAREIGPRANLCAEINTLPPGEARLLAPGAYQGPCVIRQGGEMGSPLVIRAADSARRPWIVYRGSSTIVVEVRGSHISIRGLEFSQTEPDMDAVRIFTANDVRIEDCHFTQLGGIAIVANHSSVRGLEVRRNVIRESQATAMYFGCHDGLGCTVTRLIADGNFIAGVTAPDPQIGDGMEIKRNSSAIIRDNIVMNTRGPGIMVPGSLSTASMNLVERNARIGSRTASGIVVGGGSAIVRNNIAASSEEAWIGVEDYKKRGLRGAPSCPTTLC